MVYFSCWFVGLLGLRVARFGLLVVYLLRIVWLLRLCSCCLRCFGFGFGWLVWVWVCGCFALWCFAGCIALVLGFVDCQTVRLCLGWVI